MNKQLIYLVATLFVFHFKCLRGQQPALLTELLTERAMGVLSKILNAYRNKQNEEALTYLNELEDLYQNHISELPQLNIDPLLLSRGLVNKDVPALRAFSRVLQQGRLPPIYRNLLKLSEVREVALASQLNQQGKTRILKTPSILSYPGCSFFINGKPVESATVYVFDGEWVQFGGQCPGKKPVTGGFVAKDPLPPPFGSTQNQDAVDVEKKYTTFEPYREIEETTGLFAIGLQSSVMTITKENSLTYVSGYFQDGIVFVLGPHFQINKVHLGGEGGWVGLSGKSSRLKGLGWLFHTYFGYDLWKAPFGLSEGVLDSHIHVLWASPAIRMSGSSHLSPGGSIGFVYKWPMGERGQWAPFARLGIGFWLTPQKQIHQWALHFNVGTLWLSPF